MNRYILDADNNPQPAPTDAEFWAWLDRERAARGQKTPIGTLQVAKDAWGERPDCVSTVFLGVDYGFGEGPPLVFETMLFTNDERDDSIWHYATWNEAIAGHNAVVAAAQAGRPLP